MSSFAYSNRSYHSFHLELDFEWMKKNKHFGCNNQPKNCCANWLACCRFDQLKIYHYSYFGQKIISRYKKLRIYVFTVLIDLVMFLNTIRLVLPWDWLACLHTHRDQKHFKMKYFFQTSVLVGVLMGFI